MHILLLMRQDLVLGVLVSDGLEVRDRFQVHIMNGSQCSVLNRDGCANVCACALFNFIFS